MIVTIGCFALWFTAAWLSHLEAKSYWVPITILQFAGLIFPFFISWLMIRKKTFLKLDFYTRLTRFSKLQLKACFIAIIIMFGSILGATTISLFLGYSPSQFLLSDHASFSAGIFSGWVALLIAPIIEELSWHSYGTDCLRRSFNMFWTSIIFAVYWVFWHMPLGFIVNYYQANLIDEGWQYSLNFAVSLLPFVLIMNWLYYSARRSIIVAIVFHLCASVANELFQTHPDTKIIQTVLLLILTIGLLYRYPRIFFTK
ncbi:CPBP family intramembrane metalloprotease [Bartonella sp. HY329]|uniref:CPBP family intramembrane glutamic endopeptidase n=1 Tax=unclassified Bartonella TaxID=2645622 RepID=UPI0021C83D0A|nr:MULTISPECIES: CPBP family intramembrane glutamic endopeptidase [unclassified Bartonella]UXM95173.1 CPBP family intramembrane metalloprotease [Bartonella sp. HY329]UXN09496.1 CPBP family intramembrane metalloprotease [Bartonella sp. HY328]